jgi:AAA ATPase domain
VSLPPANGPDPDRLPLRPVPRLVGRERELAALTEALSRAPALVLVEGEAGIGKTRLVQEFLASTVESSARPLVANCLPFRDPYTLGPLVDAVRLAVDWVAGMRLSGLGGALRPLFPEWADDLPPAPEPLDDATASRHRLFRAIAELLGCLDVTVLVLEDAHWADDATLEFLLFLISRAAGHAPVPSLVVTYRSEDVPADSLLRRLLSRPVSTHLRLALDPLDTTETATVVSSMLDGEPLSVGFAEFLRQHTGGIPLVIEESVRLMHDRADLVRRNGEWVRRRPGRIDVPGSVRDAVLERLDRLGPHARAIVQATAVLAEPAREDVAVAVAGLDDDAADLGVAETRSPSGSAAPCTCAPATRWKGSAPPRSPGWPTTTATPDRPSSGPITPSRQPTSPWPPPTTPPPPPCCTTCSPTPTSHRPP